MVSSVNTESTENGPSDKGSSIIGKLKKGTQNVLAYRKPSKPGNKLKKRTPTGSSTSESAHPAPSQNDKSSQVNSSPNRPLSESPSRERSLLMRRREEQAGTSPMHGHPTSTSRIQEQEVLVNTDGSKPRPLTPMKTPQGTRNRPAERPTYHHPTRLSPVEELDSPEKTDGAERPCSPTPQMDSRRDHMDDADMMSPAPMTAVRKPGGVSPVPEHVSPDRRNYSTSTAAMEGSQQQEGVERLEGDDNGDAISPVNADETESSPIKKNDRAGQEGLSEEVKDPEGSLEQVSSERSGRYDIRTIGKKEGRAISKGRQARKMMDAQDRQERPADLGAGAPRSKMPTLVKR